MENEREINKTKQNRQSTKQPKRAINYKAKANKQ